jgi:hypothetical protein
MFVPSLSWQNHRFLYINGAKMPFSAGDECFRHHRRRLQLEALARRSLEPEQRWRWVEKVAVQRLGYFRSDGYDSGHGCGIRNEPRNACFLQCSALPFLIGRKKKIICQDRLGTNIIYEEIERKVFHPQAGRT